MPHKRPISGLKAGFSLLQLSIILLVGGMILAATLPGGDEAGTLAKIRITQERMQKIEEATEQFMLANQRRPNVASITAPPFSAQYGVEDTPPTTVWMVGNFFQQTYRNLFPTITQASNVITVANSNGVNKGDIVSGTYVPISQVLGVSSGTQFTISEMATASGASASVQIRSPVVAGAVPVKTLGLPDEYMFDGFGRRLIYMVDQRTTISNMCLDLQAKHESGVVSLSSSSDFSADTFDHTMWALMSQGPDGQGATSMQGVELTNRIKTGNTDPDSLNNAFYDGSEDYSFNPKGLVSKDPTATFDDIVWVNQATKNTCAITKPYKDFYIGGSSLYVKYNATAFGDINGDGYQDMIFSQTSPTSSTFNNNSSTYAVYGSKTGWPTENANTSYPSTSYFVKTTSALSHTFFIRNSSSAGTSNRIGEAIAVGDVNGDGVDDFILANRDPRYTFMLVFGKRNGLRNMDTIASTGFTSPTDGIFISYRSNSTINPNGTGIFEPSLLATTNLAEPAWPVISDFNGDGIADIALPFDTGSGLGIGVIYGKTSSWSDITLSTAFFDGTNGVYFKVATPNETNGEISYGPYHESLNNKSMAACDVNGDGYKDLIIPGASMSTLNGASPHISVAGHSTWYATVTPSMPGDLLLGVVTRPTGSGYYLSYFNTLAEVDSGTIRQIVAYRVVPSADTASATFYTNSGSNQATSILRIRGANPYHPFDLYSSHNSSGNATTFTAPSVTTTADGDIVLYTLSTNSNQALTGTPSSTTLIENYAPASTARTSIYSKTQASAGATGTGVYTVSTSKNGVGYTIAIRKANDLTQRVYLVLGASSWTNSSGLIDPSTSPMLEFPTSTLPPANYQLRTVACKDINNDGYDDVIMYLKNTTTTQEYLYVYFGRATPATTDMDADFDIRFDLTSGGPTLQYPDKNPYITFGDLNNDGRKDIIINRPNDSYSSSANPMRYPYNSSGTYNGTTSGGRGIAYVLFQPESWGTTPGLKRGFFDYDLTGAQGLTIGNSNGTYLTIDSDAADMNNDGKDDLLIGGYYHYVIFGKSKWPGVYNTYCDYSYTTAWNCDTQASYK